jgi:hypothetical protein
MGAEESGRGVFSIDIRSINALVNVLANVLAN